MVWGLGVGYVISGNYFGWNFGLIHGGTYGLAIAIFFVIIMYVAFTYSYAELSCAIPKAGGAFDYASRALGKDGGFIAGMAQNIEFIFAPPAIALAIGSYLNLFFPTVPTIMLSIGAYFVFTALNAYGLKVAAAFELVVTTVAVGGLLFFASRVLPHVSLSKLSQDAFPNGVAGIFAAVPFAIWFFLGIEGVANLAEEARDPGRTMSIGFLSALFTLIAVCFLTFIGAVGVAGWEGVLLTTDGAMSDSPLPLAVAMVDGIGSWSFQVIIVVGLFGLVASFNGLMLAAGRSTSQFGKQMLRSQFLGRVHPRSNTPTNALMVNTAIGILALFTGRTDAVITLSVMGALTLYIVSMMAVMRLRKNEPDLHRPFQIPIYPLFPVVALIIAVVALAAISIHNFSLCLTYLLIMGTSFGIFKLGTADQQQDRNDNKKDP